MEMTIQLHSEGVERDIANLQERRENIFRALEGLRIAIENLKGKTPDLAEDIEPFLRIPETLEWPSDSAAGKLKAQELAFGIWLGNQKAPFNVLPAKAAEALGYVPDEVAEVREAWAAYDSTRSEEPARYWSAAKQKFRALPVTAEEKQAIAARNTITLHSEEAAAAFHNIREQCNLINFLNRTANAKTMITPGVIDTQFPLLARALKVKKDHRNAPIRPHQYYPDYRAFGSFPDGESCFDE